MEFYIKDLNNPELNDAQIELLNTAKKYLCDDFEDEKDGKVHHLKYSSLAKDGTVRICIYHSMNIDRNADNYYNTHGRDRHVMLAKASIKDGRVTGLYVNDVLFDNFEYISLYEEFCTGLSVEEKKEKNFLFGKRYLVQKESATLEALEVFKENKQKKICL